MDNFRVTAIVRVGEGVGYRSRLRPMYFATESRALHYAPSVKGADTIEVETRIGREWMLIAVFDGKEPRK